MKPTEQQLKDPQWWDDNVDSGLDYCYTACKNWNGNKRLLGTFKFGDAGGMLSGGERLIVARAHWVLHCKRPTSRPTETELPAKPEAKFIPKVGDKVSLISRDKLIDSVWEAEFIAATVSNVFVLLPTQQEKLYRLGVFDIRPIKSERDVFICCTSEAICGASIEQLDVKGNVRRIAGILFDAGFKAPEVL